MTPHQNPCTEALHKTYSAISPEDLDRQSFLYLAAATALQRRTDTAEDQWLTRMEELEQFLAEHGRWPHWSHNSRTAAGSRDHEGSLHGWVKRQRERSRTARLCAYQEDRLACLPGWDADPRRTEWVASYQEYANWVTNTGRIPRRTDDPCERTLARWADLQRIQLERGRVAHWQIVRLKQLPNWPHL